MLNLINARVRRYGPHWKLMRLNKIMSVTCLPPTCTNNQPSAYVMAAVLLLDRLTPHLGFTDEETEAAGVVWWESNRPCIHCVLGGHCQLPQRSSAELARAPGLTDPARTLAGSQVRLTADLAPSQAQLPQWLARAGRPRTHCKLWIFSSLTAF